MKNFKEEFAGELKLLASGLKPLKDISKELPDYEEGDYAIPPELRKEMTGYHNGYHGKTKFPDDFPTPEEMLEMELADELAESIREKNEKNDSPKKSSKKVITSIHKDHRKRVRNKFREFGLETFTPFEVLEFILFFAIPYKDTNEIAHRLIERFGSLKAVLEADIEDLVEVNGISDVSASLIMLFREVSKYVNGSDYLGENLSTAKLAGKFCCKYFRSHVEESFIVISLDGNRCIKNLDVISHGIETETAFYLRKILKKVFRHRSTYVIFAHNHPNSSPNPSANDIIATDNMGKILVHCGVSLIDHIICSGDDYFSMSESNCLNY